MKDECMPGVGGSQFDWFTVALGLQSLLGRFCRELTAKKRRPFEAEDKQDCRSPKWLAIFPVGLALFYQGAETLLRIFQFVELVEKNTH